MLEQAARTGSAQKFWAERLNLLQRFGVLAV
jgi:hypothetical protein